MTSFYPNDLFKDPISKDSHILRSWGLQLQQEFKVCGGGAGTIQPIEGHLSIFQCGALRNNAAMNIFVHVLSEYM